jgi:RNA polymerase sigma-70 factor (ECF subfamily)
LDALRLGSEKAFKEIMDFWYKRLFNFANGYLNNVENTKEVLQDVFLKLWDNRQQLAENTILNAYLFTLTRNRCIDLIRRERLLIQFRNDKKEEYMRLGENFDALSDPILDDIFAREVQTEVNRAVNVLPEQCQKVFLLSRSNGMKNKEISKMLNLSEKTVESHLTKALKAIRQSLERKFPGSLNLFLILRQKMEFLKKTQK